MSIVILGIFVADTAFVADRLPRMGETILGHRFVLGPGGKGSNQAVAAARAGGETHFLTRLGVDAFAGMAREIWAEAGVLAEVIDDAESYTGAAFIYLDRATGQNAIIVAPGAAARISEDDIALHAGLIGGAKVFVTQLEQPIPAAFAALRAARDGGAVTILNPAPAAELPEGMLALCDWVTPNESEAEALTGLSVATPAEAEAAARALVDRGAGAALVTLGDKGALLFRGGRATHIAPFAAGKVVDTTGAGDAFNGAFAVALAEGRAPEEAARFASAAAAISVTRQGAAASMAARDEIEALLAR